ncbi:hypothetical protein ACFPU1_00890 [Thalassorhabdus alkalitolerans]|uniref:Uncharacterized protein n=1 Tax=Thalassorhabdus alkalitolerans TaxID=2282697 RepID=A0ABW0YLV5_9BACI
MSTKKVEIFVSYSSPFFTYHTGKSEKSTRETSTIPGPYVNNGTKMAEYIVFSKICFIVDITGPTYKVTAPDSLPISFSSMLLIHFTLHPLEQAVKMERPKNRPLFYGRNPVSFT